MKHSKGIINALLPLLLTVACSQSARAQSNSQGSAGDPYLVCENCWGDPSPTPTPRAAARAAATPAPTPGAGGEEGGDIQGGLLAALAGIRGNQVTQQMIAAASAQFGKDQTRAGVSLSQREIEIRRSQSVGDTDIGMRKDLETGAGHTSAEKNQSLGSSLGPLGLYWTYKGIDDAALLDLPLKSLAVAEWYASLSGPPLEEVTKVWREMGYRIKT